MRHFFTLLILSSFFLNLNAQNYCTRVADTINSHEITKVTINGSTSTLNNSTNCFSLTGSQGMATGLSNRYSDFTTDTLMPVPILKVGQTYQLIVKTKLCNMSTNSGGIRIAYIDYNHDGDFLDSNETIILDNAFSTDTIKTASFNVPTSITYNGITRMRIVYRMATSPGIMQSCGMTGITGETEDYRVNIVNCPNVIINNGQNNITKNIGDSLRLTANFNSSHVVNTYIWRKNGQIIPNARGRSYFFNQISYVDSGCYKVTAYFANGCQSTSNRVCMHVNAGSYIPKCSDFRQISHRDSGQVHYFFSSGPDTVPSPYTVRYNWTFSNGQTSTQKNPIITSFPLGTSNWAKLVVCIDSGTTTICCDSSRIDSIQNCNISCFITKSGDTLTVNVNGTGGAAGYTYLWNNGNSTKTNIVNSPGVYRVTVTNGTGCTTTCSYFIQNGPCSQYRYFTYNTSGLSYNFFAPNIPSGWNVTYQWSFGTPNGASGLKNPSYTFSAAGAYIVKLAFCIRDSVNNIICCDSVVRTISTNITLPCNINANFNTTNLSNGSVYFSNVSTPTSTMYTYKWYFGDGTSSNQKNPLKIYASNGTYNVCLITRKWTNSNNIYCADTTCKNITVTNVNPCNRLWPRFIYNTNGSGVYTFTNTTNLSGFNLVSINYQILNSNTAYSGSSVTHTFSTRGMKKIRMTVVAFDVTTGLTCTKTYTRWVYAHISKCGCFRAWNTYTRNGMVANFKNRSKCIDTNTTYLYKFGDGSSSTQASPNHTYSLPGLYRSVMHIQKIVGIDTCQDSFVRIVQVTTANPCKDSGYVVPNWYQCSNYVYPVCGCDSVTYKNSCEARKAGVKQYSFGGPCAGDTNYVKICGYVYKDINKNCAYDSFDNPLRVMVKFSNSSMIRYKYTNSNGYYQIYLPKGTYQISQRLIYKNPPLKQLCPFNNAPITVNAATGGQTYCNNNFYDTSRICPDLAVSIHKLRNITPGLYSYKRIRYANRGATPIPNVVLKYRFLSGLSIKPSTSPTYTVSGNVVTWNLGTVPAYTTAYKRVYLNVPTTLPLGATVVDSVWIEPVGGDCEPSNNSAMYHDTCVGSWDPNDKTAYPANDIDTNVKEIDYLVRFQNTGTAPAFNVRIEDQIDINFDKESLEIHDQSHTMNHYFDDNGKIYFEFPNIMLPDSGTDYEASQGFVSYSVRLKDNLPIGTQLKNTAAIYFDFNKPIITNTTINTIVLKSNSSMNTVIEGIPINIYPNPSNYYTIIEMDLDKSSRVSYTIYDMQGKLIYQKEFENRRTGLFKEEINLEDLTNGVYILNLKVNDKESSFKVIKE